MTQSLALRLSDADGTHLTGLSVTLIDPIVADGDAIAFAGSLPSGVTVTTQTATQIVFDGVATVAEYQALVESIQFNNGSENPTLIDRHVTFQTNDGVFASNIATATIQIARVNDAPSFVGLDDVTTFTEDGSFVVLDSNATIADIELDAANDYDGATLSINRSGGANADDQFGAMGTLASLTQGDNLVVAGTMIGMVTTNSNGQLLLTFNTNATAALVDQTLQQITYANTNDIPPASVTLDYSINDGNTGLQGSGGALEGIGSTVVNITATNDSPTAIDDSDATDEDTVLSVSAGGVLLNDTDPENDILTVTSFDSTSTLGASVVVNADGSFLYDPTASLSLQSLAAGQSINDTLSYTISDGNGGSDTATLTITINGINDDPAAVNDSNSVAEDTAPNPVSGDLLGNDSDPDASDSLTVTEVDGVTNSVSDIAGSYGTLDWDADGTYSYTLDNANPAVQALAAGETLTDSFTYTISDGNGGTDTATLVVTINGSNDGPTAIDDTNAVTEDTAPNPVSGDLLTNDSDPDTNDSLTVTEVDGVTDPATDIAGSYGTLDWNTDGTYSYTLDNSNLAVHALADGETLNDSFTYTIDDGNSGTDTATLTITINGTNDGPSAVDDANSVSEDVAPNPVSGDLLANDSDPDNNDSLTVTEVGGVTDPATDVTGSYGILDWNADGTYSYTLNNANPTVQSLAAGETLTDSFTYTISDGNGGTDTATLIITVNGTNDGPIALDDTNSVSEDTAPNPVSGDLLTNDSDPDTSDSLTVTEVDGVTDPATDIAGSYGTLDWNSDGTYSYTLDNSNLAVHALADGETLTDSFTYTIDDGNSGTDTATLTITINGTNDGPSAVDDANSVSEDVAPNPVSGDLLANDSDPDNNDSLTMTEVGGATDPATDVTGSYGTLDWNADGTYSYTLNNANPTVQSLAAGETLTDSFTYTISDGNGGTDTATLIITVNGTNDGPAAVDDANSVTEDTTPNPVSGGLLTNDSDPDTNDSLTVTEVDGVTDPATDIAGSYGTLDWNTDGTYSYTLDNSNLAVHALADGETLTESFTYSISDGNGGTDTATLTITINGTNDGPSAVDDANSVSEDVAPNPVSGDLLANDSDPDNNDSLTVTEVGGVNDPATDVTGSYGILDWNTDGTYSYTLNNANPAVQSLAAGETLTDSFTYTISDGNGGTDTATLIITINGANDGPTAVDDTNSLAEDSAPNPVSGDLLANDSDPDTSDSLSVAEIDGVTDPATDVTGSYGVLDWNSDGTYSYTLDNTNLSVHALADGETLTESFTYSISDGNGGTDIATLTITINGTNDGPAAVDDANSVAEDTTPNPVSGDLLSNDVDPDNNDSLTVTEVGGVADPATNINGSYGTLDWNTDGTYSYVLNNANSTVQSLAAGETLTDSFTYTISDGNGGTDTATLIITVNGTNDGPAAVDDANSVTEDTTPNPVSGDLLTNDSDPDTNDSLTVTEVDGVTDPATDIAGSYGTLDWNTDGTYSYTLDNSNLAVHALADGETLTESFTYSISDGNGGTDTATLTITINGTNDGPSAVDDANSVSEDVAPNPVSGDLLANDSDPDNNDSLTMTEVGGATDPATDVDG